MRDTNEDYERAAKMAEHKQGEMDISAQEKTFDAFINISTKATIAIIVFLIFLALIAV